MNNAVKIADIKYSKRDGWNVVWIFDHNTCHRYGALTEDSLNADRTNLKPGKQLLMRDTIWNGTVQKMNFALGVAKGMKKVALTLQILKQIR